MLAERLRISSVLAIAAALACTKSEPSTAEAPPPSSASPTIESPTSAADADPCRALAQLYCENGPVECEKLEQTLREAEVPASACAKAVDELRAMLASLGEAERAILPMVLARYLPTVMLESPKLNDEQRAELEALASGPSRATEPPADFDIDRLDVTCPGVSQARGEMPPAGFERWCERDDGKRHGPASRWNQNGELVREVVYRDGEPVSVTFRMPESQRLPPELFMCPSGLVERQEDGGGSESRWCETKDGERSEPEVAWEGDRVVSIAGGGMFVHRR